MKTAVVTGASRGIGFETTKALLNGGYYVFALSRSKGHLEEMCKSEGIDEKLKWICCDVTDRVSVEESFSQVFDSLKEMGLILDVLVVNAGMGISGAIEFTDEKDAMRQFDVNLFGTMRTVQSAVGKMRENRHGKIIFISSLGGLFPLPFQAFYSATKASINVLSASLRMELAPYGVKTCYVMLNDVKTEFTSNREKNHLGNDVYGGRIDKSVSKMEKSEMHGLEPSKVGEVVLKLSDSNGLKPVLIVGFGNKLLGLLNRILPVRLALWIIGKIYG